MLLYKLKMCGTPGAGKLGIEIKEREGRKMKKECETCGNLSAGMAVKNGRAICSSCLSEYLVCCSCGEEVHRMDARVVAERVFCEYCEYETPL